MNYRKILLLLFIACTACRQLHAQSPAAEQHMKPWTRWWWMGSAVDSANINALLAAYDSAGFGGVEIVPIYGAKGYEQNYIPYLSERWVNMLDYTVKVAGLHGMGVYMSAGTGWPIGGKQVSAVHAASTLVTRQYLLPSGVPALRITPEDPAQQDIARLSALTAYYPDGTAKDITSLVGSNGVLQQKDTACGNKLIAAFTGKTKQQVKRAAPGGEGYTLDPFSYEALHTYLQSFDSAFGNTLHGVQAFYNDSYEVYGANWTNDFFEKFREKKSYDLRLYLRQFLSAGISDTLAAIKYDYREVLAGLLLNDFTRQFSDWALRKKALSLNQAHGSPGNLLDLYAAADIPETEMFGATRFNIPGLRQDTAARRYAAPDALMMQFASSAAHVTGKLYTSCETFTWLGEHFTSSWAQCKPEAEVAFLAGINHLFYHGTTYSPLAATWPGWLFYASLNAVPANSLWPHIGALNTYISRCQSILQQGKPDSDLLLYWPVADTWQHAAGMEKPLQVHNIEEWLQPTGFYNDARQLQQAGYTLDYVSDNMLANAFVENGLIKISDGGPAYKTLVIPQLAYMPLETLDNILGLANKGATVILKIPAIHIPGFGRMLHKEPASVYISPLITHVNDSIQVMDTGKGKLVFCTNTAKALRTVGHKPETLTGYGLQFVRRKTGEGYYYYLVNHTAANIDTTVFFRRQAQAAVLFDPQSGASGQAQAIAGNGTTGVRVALQPGESLFVQLLTHKEKLPPWKYYTDSLRTIALTNSWGLQYTQGGPYLPAGKKLTRPFLYTSFTGDTAAQYFSGTAVYTTGFSLAVKNENEAFLLKLDSLYESARIIVNGQKAGYIWSVPYKLDITDFLKPGKNDISIEVCNLMANRVRYMDKHGISWKNYQEINFVDINYKPFDAAGWKVRPSGLGAIPVIDVWKRNSMQ